MKITIFFFVALLLIPLPLFAEDPLGSLRITLEYTNGDRVDLYETSLIIYQDNKENLFEEINQPQTNPFSVSLPIGHKYYLEPVVNGIHLETTFIVFNEPNMTTKVSIPLSGGVKFQIFYNDNSTPIEGVLVSIKTPDGKEWKQSVTGEKGETARFWIQSTKNTVDYYIVDTSLGPEIVQSHSPIHVQPGISQDIKITTEFPKIIQSIEISIFKDSQNKLEKSDGKFVAELFDAENNLVKKTNVNQFGETSMDNIEVGEYTLKITSVTVTSKLWHSEKIVVKKEVESINIFGPQDILTKDILTKTEVDGLSENPNRLESKSCQCVAFRLDDVQDHWLNVPQIKLIQIFEKNQVPLTIGIVANVFGDDPKLLKEIKNSLESNFDLEIANHGIGNKPLTNFDKETQQMLISDSQGKISKILGVKPTSFIPPQNRFNDVTIEILKGDGITHLSSSLLKGDKPPFPLENEKFYRFPETATTGYYDLDSDLFVGVKANSTFNDIIYSIEKYGFAVATVHPQEFSVVENGFYQNRLNLEQIDELQSLISEIKENKIKFVTVNKINLDSEKNSIDIPSWVKNNAKWWSEGLIDENEYREGIRFLINKGIITIPTTESSSELESKEIPNWLENQARLWADGSIDDRTYAQGIHFLVEQIGLV